MTKQTITYRVPKLVHRPFVKPLTLAAMPANVLCIVQYRHDDKSLGREYVIQHNGVGHCYFSDGSPNDNNPKRWHVVARRDGQPLPKSDLPKTADQLDEGRVFVGEYGYHSAIVDHSLWVISDYEWQPADNMTRGFSENPSITAITDYVLTFTEHTVEIEMTEVPQ